MEHYYKRIYADPEFHELERKRGTFSWILACLVMGMYFLFILIIAFAPSIFATPVFAGGIVTWGIPIGVLVIVFSFALTGVYVYRANTRFDHLVNDIVEHVKNSDNE
ncbi:MAG: DUF485 domain-containing protein [Thiotrichales bacterium]|nr:DUF485 domain-containing protein [Thiotrichales bacterium]